MLQATAGTRNGRRGRGSVLCGTQERACGRFLRDVYPGKKEVGRVVLDSPEEIMVNKLTTLVSRSEPRNIVDLMLLERSGLSIDAALPKALEKDGGCTPATLAWVLSQVTIPDEAALPGGVSGTEARAFVASLVDRFLRAAAPTRK